MGIVQAGSCVVDAVQLLPGSLAQHSILGDLLEYGNEGAKVAVRHVEQAINLEPQLEQYVQFCPHDSCVFDVLVLRGAHLQGRDALAVLIRLDLSSAYFEDVVEYHRDLITLLQGLLRLAG